MPVPDGGERCRAGAQQRVHLRSLRVQRGGGFVENSHRSVEEHARERQPLLSPSDKMEASLRWCPARRFVRVSKYPRLTRSSV